MNSVDWSGKELTLNPELADLQEYLVGEIKTYGYSCRLKRNIEQVSTLDLLLLMNPATPLYYYLMDKSIGFIVGNKFEKLNEPSMGITIILFRRRRLQQTDVAQKEHTTRTDHRILTYNPDAQYFSPTSILTGTALETLETEDEQISLVSFVFHFNLGYFTSERKISTITTMMKTIDIYIQDGERRLKFYDSQESRELFVTENVKITDLNVFKFLKITIGVIRADKRMLFIEVSYGDSPAVDRYLAEEESKKLKLIF